MSSNDEKVEKIIEENKEISNESEQKNEVTETVEEMKEIPLESNEETVGCLNFAGSKT